MQHDAAGLPLSLDDAEAARLWDGVVAAFLAHSAATPALLAEALARAPGFALGHAAQGLFLSLLGRRELDPAIDAALAAARSAEAQGGADARERGFVDALGEMRAGRMFAAAARLEGIVATHPGDALAAKLAQAIRFMLGDAAGMRALADRMVQPHAGFGGDHPHRGYVLGQRAFALEETGDYAEAEGEGRAGLELAPDDAWGLHAVAHVMDMTGRAEAGVRWLAGKSRHWAHCNNFGGHVWWHLALFHLDRGNLGAALALYDRRVRPQPTDDYRDIANAASLLLRLELEGGDVGERWEELGALCAARTEDGCVVFADLHYLLALNRTGREDEAAALTARIARDAQGLDHDQHEVCAVAGLPAARGLNAFRAGRWGEAHRALSLALPQLARIGGSHAQRDLFERMTIDAALRAGDVRAAEAALARRCARRGAEDGYAARRRAAIAERAGALRAAAFAAG
ncbi:tetratricopeptide repeat protein [Albimonas sp. CAU 1670]|uniref:tetratricopeptide repeat protein n=1 Tax=Albimonas sp. CAU 1670 TaxID=3032599 RepID=UPI0023DC753B|nr:tetratricopeptide repeat protein [Albimonas sp. CAU 1670]MDF2232036.1 tetratricopeptide repeat protein [Albimonas sp. CAU 1670]